MADTAELKQMVSGFRVSELQALLSYAGKSKSGRKQELMERALYMVCNGCSTSIQIKIAELYRRIAGNRTHSHVPQQYPSPKNQSMKSPQVHNKDERLLGTPLAVDYRSKNVSQANQLPVHPDVRFKSLPFYDVLGELIKPTSLLPKGLSRYMDTYFVFHLTPQQAQDIAMSRDIRPNAKVEFTVQIQLRFCLLETTCPQEDSFPPSICVKVNGKMAQLPNPIPTNKPGVEPKRPSRPVNITSICRISPTIPNHISVSWASELGRGYCMAVYLVRRLTSEVLLSRLKQNGNRHADHSRALIKEKLMHDHDCEIATTSLRVSLICPLGKMRINLPCRPSTCSHLQCFDAATFLMMNEKKPTWICPVCDKPAIFSRLVLDGLFMEIISKVPSETEIEFHEDGSWSCLKKKTEINLVNSPQVTVSLDSHSPTESPKKKPKEVVIDLTLESSDEEEEMSNSSKTESSGGATLKGVLEDGDICITSDDRGVKRKADLDTVIIDDKSHVASTVAAVTTAKKAVSSSLLTSGTMITSGASFSRPPPPLLTSRSSLDLPQLPVLQIPSLPSLPQMPSLMALGGERSAASGAVPSAHRMNKQPPFLLPAPGVSRSDPNNLYNVSQRESTTSRSYRIPSYSSNDSNDSTSPSTTRPPVISDLFKNTSELGDLSLNMVQPGSLMLNMVQPGSLMDQPTPVDFYTSLHNLFGSRHSSRTQSPLDLDLDIIPLDSDEY